MDASHRVAPGPGRRASEPIVLGYVTVIRTTRKENQAWPLTNSMNQVLHNPNWTMNRGSLHLIRKI